MGAPDRNVPILDEWPNVTDGWVPTLLATETVGSPTPESEVVVGEELAPKVTTPVQLRLGFSSPTAPVRLLLTLHGLLIYVDSQDRDVALSYLVALGTSVELDTMGSIRIPIRDLERLTDLPPQVDVVASGFLSALWTLVSFLPAADTAVTVSADSPAMLNLSWTDGERRFDEQYPVSLAAAFAGLGVPFVAAPDVWDQILVAGRLPIQVGRARVNLDRFVEITALVPQRVEAAPLPALFRIDGAHFGIPLSHAGLIQELPGFSWDGPQPFPARPPRDITTPQLGLSEHAASDLRELVNGLAIDSARLVAWAPGLGRRIFCLAALESLAAFPALIVCGPHALWSWVRHSELLGRRWVLGESESDDASDADIHIVTYDMLPRRNISSPAAIVFDDIDMGVSKYASWADSLHRFDGLLDVPRVGLLQQLPSDPQRLVEMLAALRPGEFRAETPVALRYPGDTDARLGAHAAVYLSQRTEGSAIRFRQSSVELLDCPTEFTEAIAELRASSLVDEERVAAERHIVAIGTRTHMSPKVAFALQLAQEALVNRSTLLIVAGSSEAVTLLKSLLRPHSVREYVGGTPAANISTVDMTRVDLAACDLRIFDEVVVLDYPRSFEELASAVGGVTEGVEKVTVLHMANTVDDRLAIVAARRTSRGISASVAWDQFEIAELARSSTR